VATACEILHVLPEAGGLFDQDSKWIDRLMAVYDIRNRAEADQAKSRERSGKGTDGSR